MKASKAWPQIIEIPPALPDQRNADPAATSKISAFDLEQVLARSSKPRTSTPTSPDEGGNDRQTAAPAAPAETSSEAALLAKLKPEASHASPVIAEKPEHDKDPLPGSLDAGWEDPPEAAAPSAHDSPKTEDSKAVDTAPSTDGTKTAPPPAGNPTPLLPGPVIGADGIARLAADPADEADGDQMTKVGDSLVESLRGGGIAKLSDDDAEADAEASQEGLTVIGDSLVQSGMIEAPNVEALKAMTPAPQAPKDAPAEALPNLAADSLPPPAEEISAPRSLEAKPASSPVPARSSWPSSRYAIIAAVIVALVALFAVMRFLKH